MGHHIKVTFEHFSNSEINITKVRAEKADEKNVVICLVSMFPKLRSLNCLKRCNFSIKAIYIHISERSRYALSENAFVCYAMIYCFGDISI